MALLLEFSKNLINKARYENMLTHLYCKNLNLQEVHKNDKKLNVKIDVVSAVR